MKKLTLLALCIILYHNTNAQNIYSVWTESLKYVDKYVYTDPMHMGKIIDSSERIPKKQKKNFKRIAQELIINDFLFNKQNDTLLFVFSYSDHAPFSPFYVYAQSNSSKKIFNFEHNKLTPLLPIDKNSEEWFSLLFTGDINGFEELFSKKGESVGRNIALRILIKDGKIITPSYLWCYSDIPDLY